MHRMTIRHDVGFALDMAREGAGITLASELLSAAMLEEGVLVRPFAIDVPVQGAWYALCTPERLQLPRVRMFLDWLGRRLAISPATLAAFLQDAG